jgi:hypothetical protein
MRTLRHRRLTSLAPCLDAQSRVSGDWGAPTNPLTSAGPATSVRQPNRSLPDSRRVRQQSSLRSERSRASMRALRDAVPMLWNGVTKLPSREAYWRNTVSRAP